MKRRGESPAPRPAQPGGEGGAKPKSKYKCAKCGSPAEDYCVNTEQVLCRKCIGLLFHPMTCGAKEATTYTLEKVDTTHSGIQTLTVSILNAMLLLFIVYALWGSNLATDHMKGTSVCPILSRGREILHDFDAVIFNYYKAYVTTACDGEDTYWRMLVDFFYRTLIAGNDDFLLILQTLPQAVIVKAIITRFLTPVVGTLYGILGLTLSVIEEGISLHFLEALPQGENTVLGKIRKKLAFIVAQPGKLLDLRYDPRITKGAKLLEQMSKYYYYSAVLRLVLKLLWNWPFKGLAKSLVDACTQSIVTFEIIVSYLLWKNVFVTMSAWCAKKLKKGGGKKAPPMTQPRTYRHSSEVDYGERIAYSSKWLQRRFNYYRVEADNTLHVVIDESFNMVILLRLLGLILPISGIFWFFFKNLGMGGFLKGQLEWFSHTAGFNLSTQSEYMSSKAFHFVLSSSLPGVGQALKKGKALEELGLATLWAIVSRLVLPITAYKLYSKWNKRVEADNKKIQADWKGKEWTDGCVADFLEQHGSFWNLVDRSEWNTKWDDGPKKEKK